MLQVCGGISPQWPEMHLLSQGDISFESLHGLDSGQLHLHIHAAQPDAAQREPSSCSQTAAEPAHGSAAGADGECWAEQQQQAAGCKHLWQQPAEQRPSFQARGPALTRRPSPTGPQTPNGGGQAGTPQQTALKHIEMAGSGTTCPANSWGVQRSWNLLRAHSGS